LQVILGGGRQEFLPKTMDGNRDDGRDLIAEWKTRMTKNRRRYGYVKNKTELSNVNRKGVDKLLGDRDARCLFCRDNFVVTVLQRKKTIINDNIQIRRVLRWVTLLNNNNFKFKFHF